MSAPAIIHDERTAWLMQRRELITASDAWRILTNEGAYSVWAEKVGLAGPDELTQDYVLFGRDVEGAIAAGYSRKWGRPIRDLGGFTIQRHPDIAWLGCTLDRMTAGSESHPAPAEGEAPVDFKAVGFSKIKEWRAEPPLPFQIQIQIQAACTGSAWASLGPLFGGVKLGEPVDVLRNDAFLAAAFPRLEAFWLKVQRREPPEVDGTPATSEALRRLFATADGETIELDHAALALVTQWDAAKLRRDSADETADYIENQLRALLGSASFGRLPDQSVLTLKEVDRKGYVVGPAHFRTLRRWWPRLLRR